MSLRSNTITRTLRAITILVVAATSFSACYDNKEAKKIVKDYLDTHLKSADYDTEYFSKVDSTFRVTDSMLNVMQNNAKRLVMFKSQNFGNRGTTRKLNYIRVRYHINNDTIRQIFYIDSNMQHVVGIKSDF